ncbi:extracellular catalytic domain type 1 short-chain-length polyhydroxyalkanoate depolymerase [Paracidovorax valerianellae]|uniref:Esterase, PHB depolymerase family n=1 Tax=Paracidovorax valerianellae TaxID=187868 RepID=A0A1G6RSZ0_9BURK|nr:PHB depolymerase family esterase [Paracidovorax valerianellae]MDA8446029.1 PHB depolymerase family esterase [Paracidovorax valerianellae]SDD07066.1 esterase, PHB depolymerase family [Paracidovorax valerianellae]
MNWNTKVKQLLSDVAPLMRSGQLADATRAIQQALGGQRAASATTGASGASGAAAWREHFKMPTEQATPKSGPFSASEVEDAVIVERDQPSAAGGAPSHAPKPSASRAEAPGSFTRVAFSGPAGAPQDHYYLSVPPGATAGTPMPLVLMLHGCTQNPQDFATGTSMNAAAASANALVLYPAQAQSANAHGCWNWFRPQDQQRGRGEPATLVAMVRDVMARHPVDAQRVYVAGLSAGGAMAALLAREYPDVFAAVGVHSGLQAGAAHNVMGALSAMKSGAKGAVGSAPAVRPGSAKPPPLIVFHGDADETVHARNGEQLLAATLKSAPGARPEAESGRSPSGQRYTRTVYRDSDSTGGSSAAVAEHWQLHGAGHAWAGGNARGSYTDPRGVNATAQMLRFFLEHPRAMG